MTRAARDSRAALQALADEDLMEVVRRGDMDAFDVIYERHSGAAYSLAYRMVGSRAVAEDVAQEAFLSIWRSNARYDSARGSVRTWVLGITHNRAIDALRRAVVHDRRRGGDESIAERLESPLDTELEAVRRDESRSIRAILEGLPSEQSKVIELAYFGGFTHTEIAQMLETPIGTVKGRMRLGLQKMRAALGPMEAFR